MKSVFENLPREELETLKTYAAAASAHSHHAWGVEFDIFENHVQPGSRVLEVGMGSGRDLRELLKRGYDLTGTDAVPEFVEIVKRELPQLRGQLYCANVCDLRGCGIARGRFHGVWASGVYHHILAERLPKALEELHFVLTSGGVAFIAVKDGVGGKMEPYQGSEFNQRFVQYWQRRDFEAHLYLAGFEILPETCTKTINGSSWLCFFAKKK